MRRLLIMLSILFTSCATTPKSVDFQKPTNEWPVSLQPMFGEKSDDPRLIKKMDDFIGKLLAKVEGEKEKVMQHLITAGWIGFSSNKYDDAMKHFNYAWWLDRQDYRPYWGVGKVLDKNRHRDEAIELFNRALSFSPTDSNFYNDFSISLVSKWKESQDPAVMTKATMLLEKSISLNPNDADAYILLSDALNVQGKIPEAKLALEKARSATNKTKEAQNLIEVQSRILEGRK